MSGLSPVARARTPPGVARRGAGIVAGLLLTLVLAGCGASATGQVRAKVRQFGAAVHAHDYATLCHSVLGPQLLADIAAGGLTCPRALSLGLTRVENAQLTVGRITVTGNRASVLTASQATGETTSVATLVLDRTPVGWRIVSLGDALQG